MTTPYILRSCGSAYLFDEFQKLVDMMAYLGDRDDYEIEVAEPESNLKTVRNLLSGAEVVIPVDTPRCCDPSSELYWTM